MMIKVHNSESKRTAHGILRLAGASTFAALLALGAAFYIN